MQGARDFIGNERIDIVVHHSPCDDGHGAASLFYHNDKTVTLHGIHPKDDLLTPAFHEMMIGKNVVFVDIAFSVDVITRVAKVANKVIVLDHHITNQPLQHMKLYNFRPVIIMDVPGVWLAWQFLHGEEEPIPKALEYIGLKDVWKHENVPNAVHFTTAFIRPDTWDGWIPYIEGIDYITNQIIEKGKIIYDYQRSILKTMMEKTQITNWRGYRIAIINVPFPWISDIGAMLCETEPKNTIAVVWNKQAAGPYSVSLRSHNNLGPNIELIALEFKGGGHKHGAGFRMDKPPYEVFTDTGVFK
jgi:uncharacterized protein